MKTSFSARPAAWRLRFLQIAREVAPFPGVRPVASGLRVRAGPALARRVRARAAAHA
jgi:hypothetical protein